MTLGQLKEATCASTANAAKFIPYAIDTCTMYRYSRTLNSIADIIDSKKPIDKGKNPKHFKLITKKINRGYSGLSDGVNRYIRMKFFA